MPDSKTTAINQIVIECVREDDGSLGWVWDAWKLEGGGVAHGSAPTLSICLDTMRQYLKDEGHAP